MAGFVGSKGVSPGFSGRERSGEVYNSSGPEGAGGGICRFGSAGVARSTLRYARLAWGCVIKARCSYSSV